MDPLLGNELANEPGDGEITPLALVPEPPANDIIGFTADVVRRLSEEDGDAGTSVTELAERARRRLAESA